MLFKKAKNLLSKKVSDGVAPKTLLSQHQLSKVRGYRKLSKLLHKFILAGALILYFLGYQPHFNTPLISRAIARAEFIQEQNIDMRTFGKTFILPHPGYLSTRFSSWHPGIDIATGRGMPVRPITDGQVVSVVYSFWGLGNHVTVDHGQGIKSTYGHLGRVYVKNGDSVTSASTLGEVGMTGRTSGPHTHLEIIQNDQPINPQNILPTLRDYPDQIQLLEGKEAMQKKVDLKTELQFSL